MSEAERLDRLEARAAIADLIHGYARSIRYDRPEDIAALFVPDGFFEIRDGHPSRPEYSVRSRLEGAAEIGEYLMAGKGKPHPVPVIHNLMIEVDRDSATSTAVMDAQVFGTGHKVFGEYRDSYARKNGRWLFASRIFTMFKAGSPV